jgi:hypothetical protein
MEENGFGLVYLLQNYGLASIGFSLKLSDGTLSTDIPSRTDSPKGLFFFFNPTLSLLYVAFNLSLYFSFSILDFYESLIF